MNWLDQLAPCAEQLGHNSLKAIPLILLLAALQKWAQRWISPRGMKILWFLAIVRLFMPEIVTTPASVYNLAPPAPPPALVAAPPTTPDFQAETKPEQFPETYTFPSPPPAPTLPKLITDAPFQKIETPAMRTALSIAEIVTAVWLAGVAVMLALIAGQSWRFHRRFAGLPASTDPVLLALFEECRREAGVVRPVALIVSDAVTVPALYRLFRPRILLPAALAGALNRAQLRCIFQHELAHVRGWDIAINWLVMFAVAVHWFNPFVWLMARSIAQAREMACDRAVLAQRNDPQVYGETIVRVAENLSRPQIVAGVAAIVESKNALGDRIRMLTQKQIRNAGLVASAAALVMGVLFLSGAVQAANQKPVTVPGLPGEGISLADALAKADLMVVGQVVAVKFEGTDANMMDRYWVKINVTREVNPREYMTMAGAPPPIEGEIEVTNPAMLLNIFVGGNFISEVEEKIPEDGKNYLFFATTDKTAKTCRIFKMLPGDIVIPSGIPEYPDTPVQLVDLLSNLPNNIVIGKFMRIEPRFENANLKGSKIDWRQEYKALINVKKTICGSVSPGLIEGDYAFSDSVDADAGTEPWPPQPDMSKDYLFFLSMERPADNVQERLADNPLSRPLLFYLSPGKPSETCYILNKILPADALAGSEAPVPIPLPAVTPTPSLPLAGTSLSLDAAEAQAKTIVEGRVIAITAWLGNVPEYTQSVGIEIHKTIRGKVSGNIGQYGVTVNRGKEAPLEMGKDYLFFYNYYGGGLRVAQGDALTAQPAPPPADAALLLPGSRMSMENATAKAEHIALGQIVSVEGGTSDLGVTSYKTHIHIKKTLFGKPGDDYVIQAWLSIGLGEKVPKNGKDYIFFIWSGDANGTTRVIKMALPDALPAPPPADAALSLPGSHVNLEDATEEDCIVQGQVKTLESQFSDQGVTSYKIQINIKKILYGQSYLANRENVIDGWVDVGPGEKAPEMGKDYNFFVRSNDNNNGVTRINKITPVDVPPGERSVTDVLNEGWEPVLTSARVGIQVERALYEKEGEPDFFIHVRIVHKGWDEPVGIDLRDPWQVVYPNQWGPSELNHRTVVDEVNMVPTKLNDVLRKDILQAYQSRALQIVENKEGFDYYVNFNSGGRKDVEKAKGKFIVIRLKGQMFMTNGVQDVWDENADHELALATPVEWKTVPQDALVIKH